ncbi:huntingtin-interacting protein 1-related protein-like [Lingula anatina]|uniref:Huntingtin-interacting protein 1-related protein-like n=1 Tax=Lingula anatina TaxID=7574 RepID=A0A1S3I2G9_LINAN|nr:huntingtin-interacting protein 1-related protein-like [Lingula anatina]|eukprot:XP_013391539.1 huntingtin-interacting protein 1-related protein-like [Lingula anatina]
MYEYIDSMVTSRNTFFIEEISGVLMRAMQENKENKNNKAEMDKMKRLVDKLQQASDRLEQENSQLQTKLADYNKLKLDVQHLLHEKNNLLQINAETSRMCLTYSQESKRMEDRCRQAMIERDKAVRQCRQYELRIEQCEGQYKQANRLTQVLQDQLDKESKERLDEIKIENDGLRRQLDQMKRQVMHSVAPSVSENYSPMEMELEILREQVRDLEQANETYGQELMTARQAQHDAAKDKLKLCEENDKYLIKVNQLLKEVDQTKQQREEYWGQLQQIRAERDENT